MGKATREEKLRQKELAKKKEQRQIMFTVGGILLAAVFIGVMAIVVNVFGRVPYGVAVALSEDGSLHIERSSLGKDFNYVNWGGKEELILYTDDSGEVLAAFDSCEECYTRGSVHFTIANGHTLCSVCGTLAELEDFGTQEWGGCRPISVPLSARQDTDSEIVISAEAMAYAADMFSHWDDGDLSITFEDFEG